MYQFIAIDKINLINKSQLAREVGCTIGYINRILNGKIPCSKRLALCITKTLNGNAKLTDYFEPLVMS